MADTDLLAAVGSRLAGGLNPSPSLVTTLCLGASVHRCPKFLPAEKNELVYARDVWEEFSGDAFQSTNNVMQTKHHRMPFCDGLVSSFSVEKSNQPTLLLTPPLTPLDAQKLTRNLSVI